MSTMKRRVFISYGREDGEAALRMFRDLAAAGHEPWLDRECLVPGQPWKAAVVDAIKNCEFVIALLSSRTVSRRGFVNREIKEALDLLAEEPENRSFLIPARLDDCSPSHQKLAELHRVDMFPSWDEGMRQIRKALDITKTSTVSSVDWSNQAAVVMLTVRGPKGMSSAAALVTVPHVQRVHTLYGDADFLVSLEGPIEELSASIRHISELPFVGTVKAYLLAESGRDVAAQGNTRR